MRKQLTDEQLEQLGALLKHQHEQALEAWRLAMKAMPLQSYEYRRICAAGKAIQKAHRTLWSIADDRGWSDEKLQATFSYTSCAFS